MGEDVMPTQPDQNVVAMKAARSAYSAEAIARGYARTRATDFDAGWRAAREFERSRLLSDEAVERGVKALVEHYGSGRSDLDYGAVKAAVSGALEAHDGE